MKSESLGNAITAMRAAVQSDTPTMFWREAMDHVVVLLENIQKSPSISAHLDPANGCENCAMDLATCDCVEPKPVRWTISPSRDCATNSKDEDNE
ncbi:hypothetical protein AABC73_13945 [Pseudomonas sp. G.S.17]|uniref:hypothetical protein n=1 Tax=Pseudomonas sp. G.S.17 TaxID=3137451 RepID=UPI00311C93E3